MATNTLTKLLFVLIILVVSMYFRRLYIDMTTPLRVIDKPSISQLDGTDKIIWSYWHSENVPLEVKLARNSWVKNNPDYIICLLSAKTVEEYIDTSELPKRYNKVQQQHKADIIRLAVLEKYGGIWLDATIFLFEPLSKFWDPKDYDLGAFTAEFFNTIPDKPVVENWFMSAPKNSPLISAWKKEFYKGISYDDHDVYIEELERTVDLQDIAGKGYLMMHCCFLKVIDDNPNYILKLRKSGSENGPFEYLLKYDWDFRSMLSLFYEDNTAPLVKLRGKERNFLKFLWILPPRKGSVIYKILNQ